eukprot:9994308-Prorocentrum_lima.AAC.1
MLYESVLEVVANQDAGKSRFSLLSLKPDDGGPCEPWAVRANHGHSHPMPWPSMYIKGNGGWTQPEIGTSNPSEQYP